ncbi:hypothetical protein MAR_011175 [Mya arenaria]|uniref:EGF-like domain-containing protein n=1 Tax=Mya arenaria TaxID=6604 RepID=A0ABY7FX99_MYAAR|nr:hypothetical protein MAR_011175 [Mya arenaria]
MEGSGYIPKDEEDDLGILLKADFIWPEDFVGDTFCNSTINISPDDKGSLFNNEGSGENCFYHLQNTPVTLILQAPDGFVVELTVRMVTFGDDMCKDKRLLVRDGVSSDGHSVWELCSEHAESAKPEVWRGQNMFIEYTSIVGSEGKWFQLDYTTVVDNFSPLLPASSIKSSVGGDNDCSGRLLKSDGDFELPSTDPEFRDNYVPTYRVTFKNGQICVGESQCGVNQCDDGGTCVKNGHKETCHCRKRNSGEFCKEGGSSSGNLEFDQRPQNRTVKRQNQAIAVCLVKPPKHGCLKESQYRSTEHLPEGFRGPTNEEGIVGNKVFLACYVLNAKEVLWRKDGEVIDFEENTRMKNKTHMDICFK